MASRSFRAQVVVFYAALTASAAVWLWWRSDPMDRLVRPEGAADVHWAIQVGIGAAVGLVATVAGRRLERRLAAARRLVEEIAALLPPLGRADIAIAAACSSVAEEVFFRGAMQHAWGIWPSACVFAVVHGFFHPRFLLWMAFAGAMGLIFGFLTATLGSVLAPVVAHCTVNYFNLHYLDERNATERGAGSRPGPAGGRPGGDAQ